MKIIGLYGCYCHPFDSYEQADAMFNQKLKVGQVVKQRHTGRVGEIYGIHERQFYSVKYGPQPKDLELEHAQCLIKQ